MSLLNVDTIMESVNKRIEEYVKTNKMERLLTFMKYDAMVEGQDTSFVQASLKKDDNSYIMTFDLSKAKNEYEKQLVKDTYLPNGLKRMG